MTMIGICMLFCLMFVNCFGGIDGVGEEADNGNGKNSDLLFGQMWRKAFEANRHNEKERKEEITKKEMKKEPKEEEKEKREHKDEEKESKLWKKVKKEPMEEDENKLWKKVKKEPPIDVQLKEEEEKEMAKEVKMEPKEEDEERMEHKDEEKKSKLWGKIKTEESDQSNEKKTSESEERKWEIIENFDKMRKERKNAKEYKSENRGKIEQEIAKELGTHRNKIYEWKQGKSQKKKPESEEEKLETIEKFDKMRKEYKMKSDYKSEDRLKIEHKIAKELGTFRNDIYKWKRELIQKKKPESAERKWEIIKEFDIMKKVHKNRNENRWKCERIIARELGTNRAKIYEWKRKLNREKKPKNDEEKWEIIEKFDKLRKECKMKGDYNWKDQIKIEQAIAKALGTYRDKIFAWKQELCSCAQSNSKQKHTKEQQCKIIELFDKLCEEFANKFNRKADAQIKDKIAKKFGVSQRTINKWKQMSEKYI